MSATDWKERLKGVFRLKRRAGTRAGVYGESGPMPGLSSPNLPGSVGMGHPGASTYSVSPSTAGTQSPGGTPSRSQSRLEKLAARSVASLRTLRGNSGPDSGAPSVPPLPAISLSDLRAERMSAMQQYTAARDNLVDAVNASSPSTPLRETFDHEHANLSRHVDRWAAAVAGMPEGDRRTQEQKAVLQFRINLEQEHSVQGVWRRETLAAAAPGATEPQIEPRSSTQSTRTGASVEFNRSRGGSTDSERGRSSSPTSQRRADSPTRSVTTSARTSETRSRSRSPGRT
jgi:hypothetical protein